MVCVVVVVVDRRRQLSCHFLAQLVSSVCVFFVRVDSTQGDFHIARGRRARRLSFVCVCLFLSSSTKLKNVLHVARRLL